MISHKESLRRLFGGRWSGDELVIYFSTRLDEKGTDERSPFTVVGGAVAQASQWDKLETAWNGMLKANRLAAFHAKNFYGPHGDAASWSRLKLQRFEARQAKICSKNTLFRISIGVEKAVHSEIKKRMQGIKGFYPDSDYSLCLRVLMFHACEEIERHIVKDFKLTVLVEDGPWAAGAAKLYSRVSRMTGKYKPARHAHHLGGFAMRPKGETRTLEAADYLVGLAHKRLSDGVFKKSEHPQFSMLLDRSMLERTLRQAAVFPTMSHFSRPHYA